MTDIIRQAKNAKEAALRMYSLSSGVKNNALLEIARVLSERAEEIFGANQKDLDEAKKTGLPMPLRKRLLFDAKKLNSVVDGLKSLSGLEDPVGKTLLARQLDEGLSLYRISCPIGVIGIIFESRPDALVQIASLCLKAGNAVLMKGGSEARHTNRILATIIRDASVVSGIPEGWITLLQSREEVRDMLELDEYIDLIIPRGNNEFVRYIMDNTRIAVLGHADGVCHVYVHKDAQPETARRIVVDSKAQYVAVCNAAETLLIDSEIAEPLLPELARSLSEAGVTLHGCERSAKILDIDRVDDWHKEYLDYEMSVKIVDGLADAIEHINHFGSGHTDAIVTENGESAETFMNAVDSGNVFWNCSTRFSDGYKYGFGAEVGISTSKIHARGPVGLEGLITYKYKIYGKGQIVEDYASGKRSFRFRPIESFGHS
ncbi:MAG: glutamate-5-semialdehyde dehydrogenase [Clostridiaceae bacterium]|nr:glutamate-5-semialdehyde dehydrogenase [Clostridiaceae bacterium]